MKAAVDDSNRPIRLWPAVLIVIVQMPMIVTKYPFGENKVIHGWIALLIWWLLFSRRETTVDRARGVCRCWHCAAVADASIARLRHLHVRGSQRHHSTRDWMVACCES